MYVLPATGGTLLNLTNHPVADASPAWSPDGRRIAFTSDREEVRQLYLMNADGSNVVRLAGALGYAGQPAWSPDGSTLVLECVIDVSDGDICAVNADGSTFRRLTIKRRLFMALIAGVAAATSSQHASVDECDSYRL